MLDSRPKGRGFEPRRRHCVVSLSKNINPSLVLVQPRKTRPFITERLLMGRKESKQTNKQTFRFFISQNLNAKQRYMCNGKHKFQHPCQPVCEYCKLGNFCKNFIFANHVKNMFATLKICNFAMIHLHQ